MNTRTEVLFMNDFVVAAFCAVFALHNVGINGTVRSADGAAPMTGVELTALVVAVGLLAYLFVALLKPEWFS